jgi:hypothetical protein
MKFLGCAPLLALLLPAVCGCGTPTAMGPSGVSPGMLMTEVTYPSQHDAQTRINIKRDDIQILGTVQATAESSTFLLRLWSSGDNGYGNLMKAARRAYPQADGVVDIQWDTEYMDAFECCGLNTYCIILFQAVPAIYSKATSHMEGKAFQFKR